MDTELRRTKRTGDPVAELTARTRMPAVRSLSPCRHCGRDLSRVEVGCRTCTNSAPGVPGQVGGVWCWACGKDGLRGTGRTEWPWRGDTGRLALMAYAGDEAARALLGTQHVPGGVNGPGCWSLADWLRGLDRWPGALLAAGILAGRAVLGRSELGRSWYQRETAAIEALDAATDHAHCMCEASRKAWRALYNRFEPPGWLPWCPGQYGKADVGAETIMRATRETDEATIRAAICAGLISWARTGVL